MGCASTEARAADWTEGQLGHSFEDFDVMDVDAIELEPWPVSHNGTASTDDLLHLDLATMAIASAPTTLPRESEACVAQNAEGAGPDIDQQENIRSQPVELPHEATIENLTGAVRSSHKSTMARARYIPNYKPLPLQWPYQSFVLVVVVGLIALLEYMAETFPGPHPQIIKDQTSDISKTIESDEPLGVVPRARPTPEAQHLMVRSTLSTVTSSTGSTATHPSATISPQLGQRKEPVPPERSWAHPIFATQYASWEMPRWIFGCGNGRPTAARVEPLMHLTDDPSWCPWIIDSSVYDFGPLGVGYSPNDQCQEIIRGYSILFDRSYYDGSKFTRWVDFCRNDNWLDPAPWSDREEPMSHITEGTFPHPGPTTDLTGGVIIPVPLTVKKDRASEVQSPFYMTWLSTPGILRDPVMTSEKAYWLSLPHTMIWSTSSSSTLLATSITSTSTSSDSTLLSSRSTAAIDATTPHAEGTPVSLTTLNPSLTMDSMTISVPCQSNCIPTGNLTTPKVSTSTTTQISKSQGLQSSSLALTTQPNSFQSQSSSTAQLGAVLVYPDLNKTASVRLDGLSQQTSMVLSAENAKNPKGLKTPSLPEFISGQDTYSSVKDSTNMIISTSLDVILHTTIYTTSTSPGHTDSVSVSGYAVLSGTSSTSTTKAVGTSSFTLFPTPSFPNGPVPPSYQQYFRPLYGRDYFLVAVLPVMLAAVLSSLIQVFNNSLKSLLPFRALTNPKGGLVEDSLCLERGGFFLFTLADSARLLRRFGNPLPVLNEVIAVIAAVAVPLSTEVIKLERVNGLPVGIRKIPGPTHALETLLAALAAILIVNACLISRWRTGVARNPWNIATIASLLPVGEVQEMLRSLPTFTTRLYVKKCDIQKAFQGRRFILQHIEDESGKHFAYGIVSTDKPQPTETQTKGDKVSDSEPTPKGTGVLRRYMGSHLEDATQILSLLLTLGLLVLILYYENTFFDTPFERFMDSQKLGVRFMFTSFGVVMSIFWERYCSNQCLLEQFRQASLQPQPAHKSILLSPSSNPFSAFFRGIYRRDIFSSTVAFATILSKIAPITLSLVPFRNIVTWKMHEVGTWASVGILSYMVLVLTYLTFFIRQPYMPLAPTTIAGFLYYICDSSMHSTFEGLSTLGRKEHDGLIARMDKKYTLGAMVGLSGVARIGIDHAYEAKTTAPVAVTIEEG